MTEITSTQDPRLAELLEHRGEVGPDGEPTRLAVMAEKARQRLGEAERLRAELGRATREAEELETRVADSMFAAGESSRHKKVLEDQLVDVRARAALSSSSGGGASFRRQYREKEKRLREYQRGTAEDGERFETMKQAARDKAREVKQLREAISRHLAMLGSLLDGAETDALAGGRAGGPSVAVARGRRPGRRVIRRIRRRR